ncbi:MAG: hydrophobic/amphiphilic exporter (mainly bacteria), family [Tepidanaerobacteraceae bacterium]|nr:hydrophobic/amphiphilic exporter (mainly bacteria), family [Tepidanaerobacteraceae bacterium]
MSLAKLSIKHPVTMVMIIIMVLVLGTVSLDRLGTDLLPNISFPTIMIMTRYEGAGPQEVENLVTKPLEQVISTVSNVKSIRSTSVEGVSNITVEFNWGTDMDFAVLEVREKIDLIKDMLPSEVKSPQIYKYDASQIPLMEIAVAGGSDLEELKKTAEDKIKNRLLQLEGVGMVQVFGGTTKEIHVVVDPEKLVKYGTSMNSIAQALQLENLNLPGGSISYGKREYLVRINSEFADISAVKNLPITTATGSTIPLSSIAQVEYANETDVLSKLNGKPSVVLVLYKQSGYNTVQVADKVTKELEKLKKELPSGSEYSVVFNQANFINKSIGNVVSNAVTGGILAVAILYLFLRDLRTTLVIGISMPISIITTFILMYFGNLTLNLLSLGGLALGVGMLVDNSIVVLDNIFRHRQEGEGNVEAAISGANEVTRAVIASTLTTVVVFLPVVYVQGIAAQLFKELALTVTFSLLASLAVSLTLTPLLCSRLIVGKGTPGRASFISTVEKKFDRAFGKLLEFYKKALKWSLSHRKAVIGIAAVFFILSLALAPLVGTEFLPKFDMGMVMITVEMPDGTRREVLEGTVDELVSKVKDIPEIESILTIAGFSQSGEEKDNEATVMIRLKPLSERKRNSEEITEEIRTRTAKIPGVKISVVSLAGMMFMGEASEAVSIKIKGDDLERLKDISKQVEGLVKSVAGTREVKSSLAEQRPEINIRVNRDVASLYGLNSAYVANYVKSAVQGTVATRLRAGGEEIDVKVMAREDLVDDIEKLKSLAIPTPSGMMLPLSSIATVEKEEGPVSINREDQSRTVKVTASVVGRFSGDVNREIQQKLKDLQLPEGYSIEMGGEQQQMTESFGGLALAFALAILLVYMVMASQFESLLQPFIIMFTLPLAIIGVVFSLLLTGRSFNIAAFIGIITLAGIVVNNGIVLIDFINQLRERGLSREEAILKAGPIRLRPILMTTLTTVLGLFPLSLGLGEGGELRAALATVIMGGLTVSTVLTLIVVPVLYTVFEDFGKNFGRLLPASRKN